MPQVNCSLIARLRALPCFLKCSGGLALLSASALLCTYWLSLTGLFYEAELALVQLLANHPFYMSAEEAQHSLLEPAPIAWICVALSLYFTAVLLREKRPWVQLGIVMLAQLVMAVASLCAVFWGGILNMSAPMCSLLLCWLFVGLYQGIKALLTPAQG